MTINITGTLVPASSSFGIANASDLIGGKAEFATEATISAINTSRLVVGQEAYAIGSGIKYILASLTPSGIFANGTWNVYSASTTAGSWTGVATVATSNISLSGEQTLHGVTTSGSRVLVVGQTTTNQNGIYVTASGAWTRATDANSAGGFSVGKLVSVTNSSSDLFGSIWTCSQAPTTVGTDPVQFVENAASGTSFNPHAPGSIGDSTPGAGFFSALTVNTLLAFGSGVSQFFAATSVVFSSDANIDLTTFPTKENCPLILITGTAMTQIRQLILPQAGPYWVVNLTSGSGKFPVMLVGTDGAGGSTGTFVEVPPGGVAHVWSGDGANIKGFWSEGDVHSPALASGTTTMDGYVLWTVTTIGTSPTLQFPANPSQGQRRIIKDEGGNLASRGFTLSGNGNNFEDPFSLASESSATIGGGGGVGAGNGWAGEWSWNAQANRWLFIG